VRLYVVMMGSTISAAAKGCEDCRAEPLYSREREQKQRLDESERESERKGCPFCSHVQRKSYSMIGEENGGEAKG
jgi:hypothetical protein